MKTRATMHLKSVGCTIDIETHHVYTQYLDGTIDEESGTHIDDLSEDFWDELKGSDLKLLYSVVGEKAFDFFKDYDIVPSKRIIS